MCVGSVCTHVCSVNVRVGGRTCVGSVCTHVCSVVNVRVGGRTCVWCGVRVHVRVGGTRVCAVRMILIDETRSIPPPSVVRRRKIVSSSRVCPVDPQSYPETTAALVAQSLVDFVPSPVGAFLSRDVSLPRCLGGENRRLVFTLVYDKSSNENVTLCCMSCGEGRVIFMCTCASSNRGPGVST